MRWIGIDYGAKMAGTTCMVWEEYNQLQVAVSKKGQDADDWLEEFVYKYQPHFICIDAPLSLPGAYFSLSDDYFYRKCDRELQAMSPMFLGGLTARAMRLANLWKLNQISVYEVYPKGLVNQVFQELTLYYKNKDQIHEFLYELKKKFSIHFPENIYSWHQVDATLAWITGLRIIQGNAMVYGQINEGVIYL